MTKAGFRCCLLHLTTAACLIVASTSIDAGAATVTTAADSGAGSLREAIASGESTITFNIPGDPDTPQVIKLLTPLPPLDTFELGMFGTSQPGAADNTATIGNNAKIRIVIDGSGLSQPCTGIGLDIRGESITVSGLSIVNFPIAIRIENDTAVAAFPGNNKITDNFINVLPDGVTAPAPCLGEVQVLGSSQPNTISGNIIDTTLDIESGNGTIVQGNLFGFAPDAVTRTFGGSILVKPNTVDDNADGVIVGGTGANEANVIGGSIEVEIARQVRLFANDMYRFIELGPNGTPDGHTPNDSNDADIGANDLQNYPLLTHAIWDSTGHLEVTGSLDRPAGITPRFYTIAIYASNACLDTGPFAGFGPGEQLLGTASVGLTGLLETFDITLAVPTMPPPSITATATDDNGNTSEFSACLLQDRIFSDSFDSQTQR